LLIVFRIFTILIINIAKLSLATLVTILKSLINATFLLALTKKLKIKNNLILKQSKLLLLLRSKILTHFINNNVRLLSKINSNSKENNKSNLAIERVRLFFLFTYKIN